MPVFPRRCVLFAVAFVTAILASPPTGRPKGLATEEHLQISGRLSLDASGRAVRVFDDGSFDALVPVREGRNQLEITAGLAGGAQATLRRAVAFAHGEGDGLLGRLRERTLETELGVRARTPQRRAVTIMAED